ncbi:hypothetical protein W97_06841 [Coniosporium apollinis CBS 100218]|uniref:Autophagy-related protein 29 n=1 Tax=Coniosporium apollinis (strain CBS 100218) TaxID=1168221 RepID=R7Z0U5_CONA1|nr:uncharacterized protein W97_06841 [Coniosporium apollinis CBS 100218]EON67698.1 hypothetical protein W97_06841 [Coniosporium apollinis CBS 100218]
MSPPPSNPSAPPVTSHSRNPSLANPPKPQRTSSKRVPAPSAPSTHFTLLIRLPFPRGSFVDPPQTDWDAAKDRALWKTISKSPRTSDLDWGELSQRFGVSQTFLLQQAAWLYERHLSHVRAQMRRVGGAGAGAGAGAGVGAVPAALSPTPTPTPTPGMSSGSGGAGTVGGVAMKRTGSGASRAPSVLSQRPTASPVPRGESSVPGTPRPGGKLASYTAIHGRKLLIWDTDAAPLSRTPSTTTITQSRHFLPPSPRQPLRTSFRSSFPPPRRTSPTLETTAETENSSTRPPASPSPPPASSGSSSSDSEADNDAANAGLRRSQLFKRPPRFGARGVKPALSAVDDESQPGEDYDDEDSAEFLPFANPVARQQHQPAQQPVHDPSATLRHPLPIRHNSTRERPGTARATTEPPQRPLSAVGRARAKQPAAAAALVPITHPSSSATSASSTSSAPPLPTAAGQSPYHDTALTQPQSNPASRPPTALSPRHRASHLARGALSPLSPGMRGTGRDGSEGTPSMGSSFSDLDAESVTQSALEEALLSGMQKGMGSRISVFGRVVGGGGQSGGRGG